ncbi:MAG: chorismate mutase [Deltaproteobacteria bacterium]|nr:chorismate mutase [Deltaproteobacteria bacterium]
MEEGVIEPVDTAGQALAGAAPRVGYQGEPGAFGESAAGANGGIPVPFASFEDLLSALGQAEIDEAVVPIENRVVGPIFEALEPLAAAVTLGIKFVAVGLVWVPVRLALVARRGTGLAAVKRAYSHPAALRQCERRLSAMGIAQAHEWDTSGAARRIAQDEGTDAAVCSPRAADLAGLEVLVDDVSDQPGNGTRFVQLRLADRAQAQVSFAYVRAASGQAKSALALAERATLLPLPGTPKEPVRVWVLDAEPERLDALARAQLKVNTLGRPPGGKAEAKVAGLDAPADERGLPALRVAIDRIDTVIAASAQERLRLNRLVGEYKKRTATAVRDPGREVEVRNHYRALLPKNPELAEALVDALIAASLKEQD